MKKDKTTAEKSASPTPASSPAPAVAQDLKPPQADLAAADERYLRLCAEFENFKKRMAKERLTLIATASQAVLKTLLPVADDLERAFGALCTTDTATQQGLRLIYDKLMRSLQQAGVQLMPLEKGAAFDAELHEAVTKSPATDKALQGKVLEVVEKGYLLQGKVLRFAKVIIGT